MPEFARSPFPRTRMRRLRAKPFSRDLNREHRLHANDFILPMFVIEGEHCTEDVASMPGVKRYSIDLLCDEAASAHALGIPAVALFPVVSSERKSL
ncbi:porphobilinogen synthase, partial [bacterium]|nr:porphobilinogen synthase [bacterium]